MIRSGTSSRGTCRRGKDAGLPEEERIRMVGARRSGRAGGDHGIRLGPPDADGGLRPNSPENQLAANPLEPSPAPAQGHLHDLEEDAFFPRPPLDEHLVQAPIAFGLVQFRSRDGPLVIVLTRRGRMSRLVAEWQTKVETDAARARSRSAEDNVIPYVGRKQRQRA